MHPAESKQPGWLALSLAVMDLGNPALFFLLLLPVFLGRASVCNVPAIAVRGSVSFVFSIAAVALLFGKVRLGWAASILAAILNLTMILWFWAGSGVKFNQEVLAWLIVIAGVAALAIAMRPQRGAAREDATGAA